MEFRRTSGAEVLPGLEIDSESPDRGHPDCRYKQERSAWREGKKEGGVCVCVWNGRVLAIEESKEMEGG